MGSYYTVDTLVPKSELVMVQVRILWHSSDNKSPAPVVSEDYTRIELDGSKSLTSQLSKISRDIDINVVLQKHNIIEVTLGNDQELDQDEPLLDQVDDDARLIIRAHYPNVKDLEHNIVKNGGKLYSWHHGQVVVDVQGSKLPPNFGDLTLMSPHSLTIKGRLLEDIDGIENVTSLQTLLLEQCASLESLPDRIVDLTSLTQLSLQNCSSLSSLPDRIVDLTSLTEVNLLNCSSLSSLPERFGELDLKFLRVNGCNALEMNEEINKIVKMKNLNQLDIENTNISVLPEQLGECKALKSLNLKNCLELKSLPEGIGECKAVRKLTLEGCRKLDSLPERIGDLTSLNELNLKGCQKLASLPDSIGECKAVRRLKLAFTNISALPEGIGDLTSLTELDLGWCENLTSLPERIGDLTSLTKLDLKGCRYLKSLPEGIGQCESLTELNLEDCYNLESLPEGIGDLTSLTELDLARCYKLESLPKRFGELKALASLNLHGCPAGESMPAALKTQLEAQGCKRAGRWGGGW